MLIATLAWAAWIAVMGVVGYKQLKRERATHCPEWRCDPDSTAKLEPPPPLVVQK